MKTTRSCGCCNMEKNNTQFYKSPFDSSSFLPICKNCCKKKMKKYTEIIGKDSAGMWLVLSELGVPFINDIWKKVEIEKVNASPNTDFVMTYLRILAESGIVVEGFWDSDTMLDELIPTNVDRNDKEEFDLAEQKRIWGKFVDEKGNADIEAYEFLNQTFDDYTKDLLEIDVTLEKRYRDLAKAELRKRIADESGDIQEIGKAQDNLKKILDMLKLSEFKSNVKTDEQLAFESRVSMIEYTKPSECEDLKKYIDMVGYEKDRAQCFRSLRNAIAGTREYPDIPKEER